MSFRCFLLDVVWLQLIRKYVFAPSRHSFSKHFIWIAHNRVALHNNQA